MSDSPPPAAETDDPPTSAEEGSPLAATPAAIANDSPLEPSSDQGSPGPRKRPLRRRIRKCLAKIGIWLLRWTFPPVYVAYMWFVYLTSKVEYVDTDLLWLLRERYGAMVGILWHQEVFTVAYSFRRFEGHTLASQSDLGTLVAALLKLNGFVVFRGGSSSSKKRRGRVLPDLIRHMEEVPGVAYGITCDGSNGPIYEVKRGSVSIAHACHKPMMVARTWAKRRIRVGSWDRAYVPLPFNHIVQCFVGPYFTPIDASKEELETFRLALENELLELTNWVHDYLGEVAPPEGRPDFPPGWQPTWTPGKLPRYAFDPPEGHPAADQTQGEPRKARPRRRQARAVARSMGNWPSRGTGPLPPTERSEPPPE
ncbi:MAG: DUF374 domain-containing protein [Planctomycetes bacterium]|nr:DUF374 domain-containing protein [Planctomycetota bacterium]